MSGSEDSTGSPEPSSSAPCPTCGNKKSPLKITAGKYAGIIAGAVLICQLVNNFAELVTP